MCYTVDFVSRMKVPDRTASGRDATGDGVDSLVGGTYFVWIDPSMKDCTSRVF